MVIHSGKTSTRALDVLRRRVTQRNLLPYVFIAPFYVLFLVFGAFPILFSLDISFHRWTGIHPGSFVGLANYGNMLRNPSFGVALTNTLVLGIGYIPIMLVTSLTLAYILNSPELRGRTFFRTMCFLPVVTSLVVAALVFAYILDPQYGILNQLLAVIGVHKVDWLANPALEKPSLILIELWRWVGYNMVIMLAGLQGIDVAIYDAARVDGAGATALFTRIIVPLMRRVLVFSAVLSTIGTFGMFDESYVLFGTSGGTNQQALTLGVFIYRTGFQYFKFGEATAAAYLVAIIIFVFSMVQLWYGKKSAS